MVAHRTTHGGPATAATSAASATQKTHGGPATAATSAASATPSDSAQPGATPVLSTRGLTVTYGGVKAVTDVDLDVGERQLIGLIGPNGAGKTTTIDALTGFTGCTGQITLDGTEITSLSPTARARRGLARTWQGIELFDELTVRENLAVASTRPRTGQILRELVTGRERQQEIVDETLEMLDLADTADELPDSLSQGQRKLVGVARALVSKPRVILLDEPAAGLDTAESQALGETLRRVVQAGTPMLMIDHDMGLVLSFCDRVTVLDFGRRIAEGRPEEVSVNPAVVEAYLGSSGKDAVPVGDQA